MSSIIYLLGASSKPSYISSQPTALEHQWLDSFLCPELGFAYLLTISRFNIFSVSHNGLEGRLVNSSVRQKESGGNRNCRASQFPLSGIPEFRPTLIVPFPNTARGTL